MNTMQRVNKLIGDTMRAVRKARGRKRELLCRALGWLNKARAYVKRAYQMSADFALRMALAHVREAATWA
jgi:hypothetical protein